MAASCLQSLMQTRSLREFEITCKPLAGSSGSLKLLNSPKLMVVIASCYVTLRTTFYSYFCIFFLMVLICRYK